MKSALKLFTTLTLILLTNLCFASKDPIAWSLDRTFPNPAHIGRSTTITYTLTNQLPFAMTKNLIITKSGTPSNDFTYADNCSGTKLSPNGSCTVSVTLTPTTPGNITFQLTIGGYSNDKVPLPMLSTRTSGTSNNKMTGTVTQSLPSTLQVGSSANYSFSFTNRASTAATGVVITSNQSANPSFTKTNCGSSLASGQTCVVSGTFTPSTNTPTVQSVTAALAYNQGTTVSLATSTSVNAASNVVGSIVPPYSLPAVMEGGPSNTKTLWFKFTNFDASSTATISAATVNITVSGGATFTPDSDPAFYNCGTVGTLSPNGGGCNLRGTFEAPVAVSDTPYTVTATLTYSGVAGSPASIATNTTVVNALHSYRVINFVNNCNFPVWWSFHGAATGATCTASASGQQGTCTTGSSCYIAPSASSGTCFWNNPAPEATYSYNLTAAPGPGNTAVAHIPATSVDPTNQWSGTISASTVCSGSSCLQADCDRSGGTNACAVGIGFSQPATQAEATFLLANPDTYDVETINGFHIPISITPDATVTANNYYCGASASNVSANGFGACNWGGATPPSNYYYWVTNTGTPCSAGNTCTGGAAGQLCGMAVNSSTATLTGLQCGAFLGFWTPDQACSLKNAPASFNCTTALPTSGTSYPANSTYYDIMACSVPKGQDANPLYNSCYISYDTSTYSASQIATCCGCVDWWNTSQTQGETIAANPNTTSCTQPSASSRQTNPQWNTTIQPQVQWMKKSCPSAYVYPFDDKSSTFTCSNNTGGSPNSVGYTITFCPGNSGLPAGVTADGRA
jgi:hypothetical protein